MSDSTWWHYLYLFAQSNLLEVLFLMFFYRSPGYMAVILGVTICNSMTHPWVVFGWMKGPWSYLDAILLAETFAIVTETFLHRWLFALSWQRAFAGSLIANLISWQMGPILTAWFFLQDKL